MREEVISALTAFLKAKENLSEHAALPLETKTLQQFLRAGPSRESQSAVAQTKQSLAAPQAAEPAKPVINGELPMQIDPRITLPQGSKLSRWQWLKDLVLHCPTCLSHVHPGKKVVFGSGNLDADVFFCGEAPGADEEIQGKVFVGRAGQLLTKIIEAMGIKRSDVYIGNIMNWRPETPNMIGNRPPTQKEMEFCLPYLKAQVEIVQPKVIVALGATAVNGLLGHDPKRRMRECRGKWFSFENIPLLITYHPSYLLRNATKEAKRTVWEDMLHLMEFLEMPISPRQRQYFL